MSDPWAQRLKWGGRLIIWLVSLWMAWNGGWAAALLSESDSEMKKLRQAIREEAPRIDAATDRWIRCRQAATEEACE